MQKLILAEIDVVCKLNNSYNFITSRYRVRVF